MNENKPSFPFKAWRQERMTTSHGASVVGKQRDRGAGAQLANSYLFGPQPTEWHCPQLGWVLQHKLTQFRNSCRQA